MQIRRTIHVGHCWRSKDKLISNILLLNPSHKSASVDRPTRTSVQTQDVIWKTYRKQRVIEMNGKKKSGKSVLAAHDDDDMVSSIPI